MKSLNLVKLIFLPILFILVFSSSYLTSGKKNKFVIGTENNGFFSSFFGVLNKLAWCQRKKKTPVVYWDKVSRYYNPKGYNRRKNVWEYYFRPVSNLTYNKKDKIYRKYFAPDKSGIKFKSFTGHDILRYKHMGKALIDRYIRPRYNINGKIKKFYNKNIKGKKTIGIHLRGTDKHKEVAPISVDRIIKEANKYKGYQYFITTDELSYLKRAQKKLNGKVIYYNSQRSKNGKPIHTSKGFNRARAGEEVLIEVLLLSSCDKLIHTPSNVSCAVLFFNPKLKNILLYRKRKSNKIGRKINL